MKTQQTKHITVGNSFLSQGPSPKEQREAMERRLAESEVTPAQASGNCQTSHSPLTGSSIDSEGNKTTWKSQYRDILAERNTAIQERNELRDQLRKAGQSKAHAQRLADALKAMDEAHTHRANEIERSKAVVKAREALAQWNESPADADALEALDQLEQLEGRE